MPLPSGVEGADELHGLFVASDDSISIRSLALSTEAKIFLGVVSVLSVAYIYSFAAPSRQANATGIKITPPKLDVGTSSELALTLISADAYRLSCASDTVTKYGRCGFTASGEAYKGDPALAPETTLVPYMTADNVLVLIPGLWKQPLLAKRLEDEPPGTVSNDQMELRRFTTTCKVEIVDKMKDFKVRWISQGQFGQPHSQGNPVDTAPIGKASDCRMTGG